MPIIENFQVLRPAFCAVDWLPLLSAVITGRVGAME
jgi:hypothetical protein